jgi:hypothetical protein
MRIQTNYVHRFHLHVDPEAQVLDCFRVQVLGQNVLIAQGRRKNVTLNQLWREMLEEIRSQRKAYHACEHWKLYGLHNPLDLDPFAIVTACEEQREDVKMQVNVDMICGGNEHTCSPAHHEAKVRHLIDAWDGLQWLEMN